MSCHGVVCLCSCFPLLFGWGCLLPLHWSFQHDATCCHICPCFQSRKIKRVFCFSEIWPGLLSSTDPNVGKSEGCFVFQRFGLPVVHLWSGLPPGSSPISENRKGVLFFRDLVCLPSNRCKGQLASMGLTALQAGSHQCHRQVRCGIKPHLVR